ncbi:hypothetical protein SLEP1_g23055 [Rubroshorea leprosula]|uniref:Uncharacterized protein n=1 Tax=Rubroshorea leprosula TaxID=152421 RepID=A0AAV5JHA3_9ROSI|nr:hypothetical protein SLEP1_g23055 [Rubroshorea leprosula]
MGSRGANPAPGFAPPARVRTPSSSLRGAWVRTSRTHELGSRGTQAPWHGFARCEPTCWVREEPRLVGVRTQELGSRGTQAPGCEPSSGSRGANQGAGFARSLGSHLVNPRAGFARNPDSCVRTHELGSHPGAFFSFILTLVLRTQALGIAWR